MPARPHPFRRLDELERRYDGPIPPHDPAAIGRPPAEARARLFARLADETRANAAKRRARVCAAHALRDGRLEELTRTLGTYRAHGVAWATPCRHART